MTERATLEGIAADLLDETCTSSPVDAYALAKACEFDVKPWSGVGAKREGNVIKINPRARPQRRQGLIAHELGHFALERAGEPDSEDGARYIAGALRLPRRDFDRDLAQTAWSIARLRERHIHVSAMAIAVRITQLRQAVVTVVDPFGRARPWRLWSPELPERPFKRITAWERELVRGAVESEAEYRGDQLCYAFPLFDETGHGWSRVIIVCEAEQLSLRLDRG
jgi:Zn-dependent peptidase ImmA (M78 family)